MTSSPLFAPGNYHYVPGVFQYSGGVAAAAGYMLERARFARPPALAEGFAAIAAHLAARDRPLTAFCQCELRSPEPFTEAGFAAFNRTYVGTLESWGLYRDGINPVARSNVCPELDKPASPVVYAFSYTVALVGEPRASFAIAGSAECPEGQSNYRDHVIRPGDTSAEGLREKASFVLAEMERRMHALGTAWSAATATQAYTVHDLHPLLAPELMRRGAMAAGLTWHYARPPVRGLDFEMDVRGIMRELVL